MRASFGPSGIFQVVAPPIFANLSKDRYLITWGRRLPGCLTFDPPSVERRVKLISYSSFKGILITIINYNADGGDNNEPILKLITRVLSLLLHDCNPFLGDDFWFHPPDCDLCLIVIMMKMMLVLGCTRL